MTDRIELAGLNVARELHAFVADEALPGTGIDEAAFWQGFSAIVHDLAPKNRALLARREALQDQHRPWHRDNGAPADLAAYKAFLREIGYLLPEGPAFAGRDRECRSRDRRDRRAAAGRAGHECALCAERRQCALGLALRRALRHRRDPRDRRRRAKGKGYNPAARRQGHRLGARISSTKRRRSTAPAGATVDGPCGRRADAGRHGRRHDGRPARRRAIRRLSRRAGLARGGAAEEPRPAHRDRHRPRPPDRQDRPGRHRRRRAGSRRSPRSRTARIRSPPSMPTTRSSSTATGSA